MKKKAKKIKSEKSHDLIALGVKPVDLKDFQRVIGGGFMMSDDQIKASYAEYRKAQELNTDDHLEMIFMIPKIQGSLVDGGIVTGWSGTQEAFLDPVYMQNVLKRAYDGISTVWKGQKYFTEAPINPKIKKSKYGYWKKQPLESYSVAELIELVRQLGAINKRAKGQFKGDLELI